METRREWIANLVKDVKTKQAHAELLKERGSQAMYKLRSVIQTDLEEIDKELSGGNEEFYVREDEDNDLKFKFGHFDSSIKITVDLRPDDLILVYQLSGEQQVWLNAIADKSGGVSFFYDRQTEATPEHLSQMLIDLLVREVYQISKQQKR